MEQSWGAKQFKFWDLCTLNPKRIWQLHCQTLSACRARRFECCVRISIIVLAVLEIVLSTIFSEEGSLHACLAPTVQGRQ